MSEGELVAVMGASGSGKSTLLAVAGGLTTPTSGEVVVEGLYLSEAKSAEVARLRRRTLGFVFQDFNLIPTLTAHENVSLRLELDGWKPRKARTAANDALASVEFTDRADHFPDDLSGGQQQRVAIARAAGATRLLRRTFAFWQAVVLVGIGTVTGTIAGLITTFGVALVDTSGYISFEPPWIALAALVIGMPLAMAIGSWLVASQPTTLAHRVAIG